MSNITKISADSASPSLQGRREMSVGCDDERFISPKECRNATCTGWVRILKILIAVLTALAGSIGVVSCTMLR